MKALCMLVVSVFLSASAYAQQDNIHLCKDGEIMMAACQLAEKKSRIVSFCSSPDRKTIFYRFGTISKYEMERLFSERNPLTRWVDKATYTVYFGFSVSEFGYSFGIPEETVGALAFLDVKKDNAEIMSKTCTQNSFGEKHLLNGAIREADDKSIRRSGFVFPPK